MQIMKCEIHCNVRIRNFYLYPVAILAMLKIPVPKWMFSVKTKLVEV